jgi:CopG family transcriptional regulator, nickel-responsive regulator
MGVIRFGVSVEQDILDRLDEYVKENKFTNRSQAIRHLVSKNIVEKKWQCDNIVAGSVTLIYDHHKNELLNQLTQVQHDYHEEILSSQHCHLDHNQCLEIVAVKGKASRLTELADKLIAIKGIQHGKLTMTRAN